MKRFLPFLIVILALLITSGDVMSKMKPSSYWDLIKPDGDDHPWGGEGVTEPDPDKTSNDGGFIWTGNPLIDVIFNKVFITKGNNYNIIRKDFNTSKNRSLILQQENSESKTTKIEGNKGNL